MWRCFSWQIDLYIMREYEESPNRLWRSGSVRSKAAPIWHHAKSNGKLFPILNCRLFFLSLFAPFWCRTFHARLTRTRNRFHSFFSLADAWINYPSAVCAPCVRLSSINPPLNRMRSVRWSPIQYAPKKSNRSKKKKKNRNWAANDLLDLFPILALFAVNCVSFRLQ